MPALSRPVVAVLAAGLVLLASCTSGPPTSRAGGGPRIGTGGLSPLPIVSLPPASAGPESAQAVQARLCRRPPVPKPTPASPGPVPQAVWSVERQVQAVRGLRYLHPVAVEPVTHEELVRGIDQSFDHSYPADLYGRRGRAWQAIGVIPKGVNLREAFHAFFSSQVIGYYDPTTGQLVFIGTANPSPTQRLALAHELTHADDDQHFDLTRLNALENRCQDERQVAALGAVEGSAQFFMNRVGQRFLSLGDAMSLLFQGGAPPPGVPLFVQTLLLWPYVDGVRFIAALDARGGLAEVNRAIRNLPVSTEQVIHPEKYPSDAPQTVDVPALGPPSGRGWRDLDVMDVGEEWLRAMLQERLPSSVAAGAAAGWDGGRYRAWAVAGGAFVEMVTAWDTHGDARQFAAAADRWIAPGQAARVATAGERGVVALFAADRATLDAGLRLVRLMPRLQPTTP